MEDDKSFFSFPPFFPLSHMVEMKSNYICDCASFALKESAGVSHHSGTRIVLRKPVARRDGANVQRQSWVCSCLRSLLLGAWRSEELQWNFVTLLSASHGETIAVYLHANEMMAFGINRFLNLWGNYMEFVLDLAVSPTHEWIHHSLEEADKVTLTPANFVSSAYPSITLFLCFFLTW